jgi:hypothetical protein
MTSEFILTGGIHDPLSNEHPIKLILTGNGDTIEYEEIGVLRVKQSDMDNLSKAVELAKKEARLRGGDIVLLLSSNSRTSVSGNAYGVFASENNSFMFVVGKLKE